MRSCSAQRQRPSKPVPKARGSGSSKPSSSRAAKSAASSSQPKARIPAGSKRPAPEIASEAEDLDPEDDEERMAMEDDVDDLEATPRATRHDAKVVRSRNQKATRAASTRTEGQNFTRGRAASDASILGSDAEEAHGRGQRAKKNLANTQRMRQLELEDAEALDEDDNLELDDEIGHTQKPTRREKELEDRLAQVNRPVYRSRPYGASHSCHRRLAPLLAFRNRCLLNVMRSRRSLMSYANCAIPKPRMYWQSGSASRKRVTGVSIMLVDIDRRCGEAQMCSARKGGEVRCKLLM